MPNGDLYISKSKIHGFGLFVSIPFGQSAEISKLCGTNYRQEKYELASTEHWPNAIGIGPLCWIIPTNEFAYINHSCSPNAYVGADLRIIAAENLNADDEITIDYSTIEADPFWSMDCNCKASNCRKKLLPIHLAFETAPQAPELMLEYWKQQREAMKAQNSGK